MKTTIESINKAKEDFDNRINTLAEDFRTNILLPFCKNNNVTWKYSDDFGYYLIYNSNHMPVYFNDGNPKESSIRDTLNTEVYDGVIFASYITKISRYNLETDNVE